MDEFNIRGIVIDFMHTKGIFISRFSLVVNFTYGQENNWLIITAYQDQKSLLPTIIQHMGVDQSMSSKASRIILLVSKRAEMKSTIIKNKDSMNNLL